MNTLGDLTASIAHEVTQPLSGIITHASTCLRMLDSDPPDIEGARETARRAIRDGYRASDVVSRLRAFFGGSGSTIEAVDLNDATREVVVLSRKDLLRNHVTVLHELAADLPNVLGDRVQLQQVILNLLLNASEAMRGVVDRARQVRIRTEREGDRGVRVTVRDTGEGLDPLAIEKIFEPFYTTKADCMGIGLALSRSIVELHGGRIDATPNPDGPGATFSVLIPLFRGA